MEKNNYNLNTLLSFIFILLSIFFLLNSESSYGCSGRFGSNTPPSPPCNCDCDENCRRSPNYIATGNYLIRSEDLQLPTAGFTLSVTRNYSSMRAVDGPFGVGWTSNISTRLTYSTYLFQAPSTYKKEAAIIMPDGRLLHFLENADGTTYTSPVESKDTLIKNGDGTFDLTLKLSRSRYRYSAQGSLISMIDDYGNTISFSYDAGGLITLISDSSSGRTMTPTYGANGRISNIQDSAGRTTQYNYNAQGALSSVINAAGHTTTYSYVTGRYSSLLSQIRDHWGRVVSDLTYDSSDRLLSYTEAGETYTYTYKYQLSEVKTSKTDSANKTWVFTYDSYGRVTQDVPPSGSGAGTTSTIYNTDGSIQSQTDGAGIITSYTYNPNGSVATITRDSGGAQAIRFDYSYDPNFAGKVISITPKNPANGVVNPDWQASKYDYYQTGSTAPGALFHVYRVRSDGVTLDTIATYTYNSKGQVLTSKDATNATTTYTYDPVTSDLLTVTYPKNSASGANPVYTYTRDSAGRVTSVKDPLNNTTTYTYDNLDRVSSVTLPKPSVGSTLNFITIYSYDNYDAASGLLFTHQTDPNGRITKQGFDQYGQMVKSIDSLNQTTTFTYTKGKLTSIKDANNNSTSYTYNFIKQLSSTVFPDSTTETYTYHPDGLLNTKTDRKNQTTSYSYDRLKRVTLKSYSGSSVSYTYVGQKLTSVNDTFAGTDTFSYDPSYRISSNTQGTRGTLTYTYDVADRVATYTVQGGPTATYTYFADGSLKDITWSPIAGTFGYTYKLNGPYNIITFPNNQKRTYSYDDQGRLTSIVNNHTTPGNIATYSYAYDKDNYTGLDTMLGQRHKVTTTVPSQGITNKLTDYFYDGNYQLNKVNYPNVAPFNSEIDSWTYDAIGNRLTNTVNGNTQNYTYYKNGGNPLNGQRLQSDSLDVYTYDNNGNMITKSGAGGNFTYTWDVENRLTGISGPSLTASYIYDSAGRRISKTVNSITTTYLYDGQNLIREFGPTTVDYVFGPSIDEPLAMNRNGSTYYYNVDGLGSATVVNDTAFVAQDKYVLDAWGISKSQTVNVPNPFTYTSREVGEAGLLFYRARYYNPGIGRFVSEDPIRFWSLIKYDLARLTQLERAYDPSTTSFIGFSLSGGLSSNNFYSYVLNDPVNFYDPDGLTGLFLGGRVTGTFRPSHRWNIPTSARSARMRGRPSCCPKGNTKKFRQKMDPPPMPPGEDPWWLEFVETFEKFLHVWHDFYHCITAPPSIEDNPNYT